MKQVIVFPRGQLSPKDRERISRAGAVAVEADDPARVVTAIPLAPHIPPHDMLAILLRAVSETDSTRSACEKFVKHLAAATSVPSEGK